jgi:hypothetical protein
MELYLILYYNPTNVLNQHKDTSIKCKYDHVDIKILILDEANRHVIKDICHKTIKNTKPQNIIVLNSIEEKYNADTVWLLWSEFMNMSNISKDLSIWLKLQFDIFVHRYTKITSRKRIAILYSIIDLLSHHQSSKKDFVFINENIFKPSFLEIILKIDYIYQEIGFLNKINNRQILSSWATLMFPPVILRIDNISKNYIQVKKDINVLSKAKKFKIELISKGISH